MYQHLLIIGSKYNESKRVAMHFSFVERLSNDQVIQIKKIKEFSARENLDIILHSVETNHSSIESVVKSDPYFQDIEFYSCVDLFLSDLLQSQEIIAKDVAQYILSTLGECSNLKLQKLIYFSFEEYLVKTGKKLFPEKIIAYKLGPVIEEVYREYKIYGRKSIKSEDILELVDETGKRIPKSASYTKFMASDKGIEMATTIDSVLEKYGKNSAWVLVDRTHEEGSPWDVVFKLEPGYGEITPEIILENISK